MPHLGKRYLVPLIQQLTKFSPITGILGHRQVGKTTLLEGFSDDFHTFDQALEKKTDIRSYKEFIGILDAKINIKESKIKLEKSKHKC